jgi:hypothetical protein
VFIALAIVSTAGTGTWGLLNHHAWSGGVLLGSSALLVVYGTYFSRKAQELHLK